MRSKLLASVALASFAVVASPHSASAAATMKISGSYEANMSWTEESRDDFVAGPPPSGVVNSPSSGGLIGRLRLQFDPSMTVDSLTVGARLRTHGENGTFGYDRAYGYVNTGFGNISFGLKGLLGYAGTWGEVYGNDSQGMVGPDQASVATKAFKGDLDWRIDGAMGNYVDAAGAAEGGAYRGNVVQYETPNFMGLTAGVSYAPQWGKNTADWSNSRGALTTSKNVTTTVTTPGVGDAAATTVSTTTKEVDQLGAYTNLVEVAVKYGFTGKDMLGSGSDLVVNVAAGYLHAEAPRGTGAIDAVTNTNLHGGAVIQSLNSYGASFNVKAAGVYFEVGYTNGGKSGNRTTITEGLKPLNTTAVTVTTGYNITDAIAVGGYFASGYASDPSDLVSTNKLREYGVGAQYTVMPGFSVYVAADHIASHTNAVDDLNSTGAKATIGSIGTTIVF